MTIIVMLAFSLERHLQSRSNLRQLIRLVKMKSKLFNGNMKRDSPYLWLLSGKIKKLLLVSLIVDGPRKLTKYLLEINFSSRPKQLYIVQNACREDTAA